MAVGFHGAAHPPYRAERLRVQLLFQNERRADGGRRWSCVMSPDGISGTAVAVEDADGAGQGGAVLRSSGPRAEVRPAAVPVQPLRFGTAASARDSR